MTVRAEHLDGDRYRVRIYAGKDRLGRQHQRTRTFRARNQREANKLAAGHEAKLRADLEQRRVRGKTLNGLIDEWQALRDAEDSPSTVRKRQGMIRRIRAGLGPLPLDDLSARHVDRWMAELKADGLSATTIANHWSCLRAILRQGDRWDMATARPTTQASPPRRISNRRPTPPTAAAARVLIDAATPDLRIAAMLGAYAGLRRGEVMALRWCDFDRTERVVHVRHAVVDVGAGRFVTKLPKSEEPRDVDIDVDLADDLAAHRRLLERRAGELGAVLAADAYVIPRLLAVANGRAVAFDPAGCVPRPLGWLTLAWRRHAARMGAPSVRFHDLRHLFASEQLDAGVALKTVQDRMGHKQLKTTTDIYGHAATGAGVAAAEVLRLRRMGELGS